MFEIKYDRLTNTTRIETKNLNILGEDKKIKVEIVNIIKNYFDIILYGVVNNFIIKLCPQFNEFNIEQL